VSASPTPRTVDLEPNAATAVARAFGLGEVRDVALAARGWASLNVTWALSTTSGVWAVKEVTRESREELEAAAEIESAAEHLGISIPRMIRAKTGTVTTMFGGRVFRCHEFVDGDRPAEDVRASDAAAAGAALARLHAAALPWDPILMTQTVFGEDHWMRLVERGERVAASWASGLRAALPAILSAERAATHWRRRSHRWIGSHRDVRPDNALRVADQLVLLDWDGAGPIVPGREVAGTLRWWSPHSDTFLNAYVEVAGDVELDESPGEDGGLVWWLETNVERALALPRDQERAWAVSTLATNFEQDRWSTS
jgi:Ser/Thr protein kinase RdoA (MazF antagonist)